MKRKKGDDSDTDSDEKQRLTILYTYLLTSIHPSTYQNTLLLMEEKKKKKNRKREKRSAMRTRSRRLGKRKDLF